jgi:DNA processing protein
VLGVPGSVTSAQSQGVHHLLRTAGALLVTSGADVLDVVGRPGEHLLAEPRGEVRPRDQLSQREAQVLDAVPVARAASADSIARTAGVGLVEVGSTLLRLHKRDLVAKTEGGWILGDTARA